MKSSGKTLIVIAGPTAVGKSALAIQLAKKFQTEIISADSRQFFKELNIGTAKPPGEDLEAIPHHFINSLSIHQEYDAAQFGREALIVINKIFLDKDYAILCGGSGLYIKAVCEGLDEIPQVPDEIRETLKHEYSQNGIGWLQDKMKKIDPEYFQQIDQQNPQRLMRALEIKLGTGQSISSFRKEQKLKHDFNIIKIGLELPRPELYTRIDERMETMIGQGLFQEADFFFPFRHHHALQTVGYQEIFDFMEGKYDRDEAIRLLKRNSRRYAKRQLTWFKRDPEIRWFQSHDHDEILAYILRSKI